MTKFKHNKRRNSAFLYEVLVLELAKSVIAKDKEMRSKLLETIKLFFHKSTSLGQELRLYKEILNTKDTDEITAEKMLQESKRIYFSLDKEKITDEQNKLYYNLKSFTSPQKVFANFVPNYKDLATISQIFNKDVSVKTRILLENELLNKMTSKLLKENKMVPIDNLVLKSFINRFNDKYQGSLLEEQKKLLNKFITSFADNGLELKVFMNEELKRLKIEVNKSFTMKEFLEDQQMMSNIKKVYETLEGFSKHPINEQMVKQVINIQKLVREINS
jgi:hypothetical protein